MFQSLDRRFLYTAHKIVVTFNDYENTKECNGTCFFVNGQEGRIAVVTNRHVLDPGFSDIAKRHWVLSKIRVSGFLPDEFNRFEGNLQIESPKYPVSQLEDVALALIVGITDGSWDGHSILAVQNIPREMLATESDFNELLLADAFCFPVSPTGTTNRRGAQS